MVIYLISPITEICHIMAKALFEHRCYVFSGYSEAYATIADLKMPPDLLVLDYTLFNHEIFHIIEYMDAIRYRIPLIFFNDPCPIASSRADHWEQVIKMTYDYKEEQKPEVYHKVYEIIESVVENPELRPYIPLMQKFKPLPKHLYVTKMYEDSSIKASYYSLINFKNKSKMSNGIFFLMELFYRNSDKAITLEELQKQYEDNRHFITIESLKVQISRLRTFLKNHSNNQYAILTRKDGYQLVVFP
ncbi:MAG: helix-turn-helix domain-containing protein [Treponema sp.]|nr:helix-turn-helix domain-containing protein [Treponema sp.]